MSFLIKKTQSYFHNSEYPSVMVFLDQIISNLEQPICVVRKLDHVITYKNLMFSKLIPKASNKNFYEIFTLTSDHKNYNSLNEVISNYSVEASHTNHASCSIYVDLVQGMKSLLSS